MNQSKKRKIQRLLKRQLRASDSEVEAIVGNIERIISRELASIERDILRGGFDSDSALQVVGALQGLEASLEQAGLTEQVRRLQSAFGNELDSVLERLEVETGFNPNRLIYSDLDLEGLETLASAHIEKSMQTLSRYIANARLQISAQVIAGQPVDIKQFQDRVDAKTYANLKTDLRTSLAAFNRSAHAKQTEALGFKRFEYLGADDNLTREFCDHVLSGSPHGGFNIPASKDGTYTSEQIAAMDNGQGLDVRTNGGGYNCRHTWIVVDSIE
jgi:hypothetical protein